MYYIYVHMYTHTFGHMYKCMYMWFGTYENKLV